MRRRGRFKIKKKKRQDKKKEDEIVSGCNYEVQKKIKKNFGKAVRELSKID